MASECKQIQLLGARLLKAALLWNPGKLAPLHAEQYAEYDPFAPEPGTSARASPTQLAEPLNGQGASTQQEVSGKLPLLSPAQAQLVQDVAGGYDPMQSLEPAEHSPEMPPAQQPNSPHDWSPAAVRRSDSFHPCQQQQQQQQPQQPAGPSGLQPIISGQPQWGQQAAKEPAHAQLRQTVCEQRQQPALWQRHEPPVERHNYPPQQMPALPCETGGMPEYPPQQHQQQQSPQEIDNSGPLLDQKRQPQLDHSVHGASPSLQQLPQRQQQQQQQMSLPLQSQPSWEGQQANGLPSVQLLQHQMQHPSQHHQQPYPQSLHQQVQSNIERQPAWQPPSANQQQWQMPPGAAQQQPAHQLSTGLSTPVAPSGGTLAGIDFGLLQEAVDQLIPRSSAPFASLQQQGQPLGQQQQLLPPPQPRPLQQQFSPRPINGFPCGQQLHPTDTAATTQHGLQTVKQELRPASRQGGFLESSQAPLLLPPPVAKSQPGAQNLGAQTVASSALPAAEAPAAAVQAAGAGDAAHMKPAEQPKTAGMAFQWPRETSEKQLQRKVGLCRRCFSACFDSKAQLDSCLHSCLHLPDAPKEAQSAQEKGVPKPSSSF